MRRAIDSPPTTLSDALRACSPQLVVALMAVLCGCGNDEGPSGAGAAGAAGSGTSPQTAANGASGAGPAGGSPGGTSPGGMSDGAPGGSSPGGAASGEAGSPAGRPAPSGGMGGSESAAGSGTADAGTAGSGPPIGGGDAGMPGDDAGSTYAEVECPATFENPLVWEDLPDLEVIRVGDVYYYTASTFHHSPGAPVLRSYDLVNWQYVGHSVPRLDFDPSYDLSGGVSYRNGIWALTLRYRPSDETFYWMGCMAGVGGGYVFTSRSAQGPWEKHRSQRCYYDMGLLVDDDDKLYVAYGNGTISVAELSADGLSEVRSQQVYSTPGNLSGPLEGSRFYKIDGDYYILVTQYANGEYVLRSSAGPFGPYEMRPFAVGLPYAGSGAGASPHQGGIVETRAGDWYYIAFNDSFPAGRLPVMAPVTFSDGWPSVTLVNGQWGASYPFPNVTCRDVPPRPHLDRFDAPTLGHEWEWNHNPDDAKWSTGDGLTLQTATVTSDIFRARNTLTRRIEGPASTATIELDYSLMQNGDMAGLAAFRDSIAWVGVKKDAGGTSVVMKSGMDLSVDDWRSTTPGSEVESADVSGGTVWLRVEADIRTDAGGGTARFSYSTDGSQFVALGNTFAMRRSWNYFLGYRFGIFNYATQNLGGEVKVRSFQIDKP